MEFKTTFFAIIIFSVLMIAVGVIINQRNSAYNTGITSDLEGLNKLEDVGAVAEEHQDDISPQSGEASSDFETETFRGGYGTILKAYDDLRSVYGEGGIIDSLTTRYGIPDYIRRAFIYMVSIAILFGIVAIVFRLGRTSA